LPALDVTPKEPQHHGVPQFQEAPMEPLFSLRDQGWEVLRRRRAELRESMDALEQALAAPVPGRVGAWAERVNVALVELSADFREHVDITEGPDGLYRGVLSTAPRLSNAVNRLTAEHAVMAGLIHDMLTSVSEPAIDGGVDDVRDLGTMLLGRLIRHRQRGADLIYEAYEVDVGGET
jgi:hypothetical protein